MNCPASETLIDYLRNRLAAGDRVGVEAHLQTGCARCAEERAWLSETVELAATDDSFSFSEDTIKWAVNLFRSQPAPEKFSLPRFVASLLFDSFGSQPVAAVRSNQPGTGPAGRQMLWQTEGYDIDLRFEAPDDSGIENLIGQVLAKSPSDRTAVFKVTLRRDGADLAEVETSTRGLFRLNNIPSGYCDLTIRVPEGEIAISQVPSAQARPR